MKRVALLSAVVLATLLGAFFLWSIREALLIFGLALAVAAALRPLVERLRGKRVPHGLALAVVYAGLVVAVVATAQVFGPPLIREVGQAAEALTRAYESVRERWPHGSAAQRAVAEEVLPRVREMIGSPLSALAQSAVDLTVITIGVFAQAVFVLALSIYWLVQRDSLEALVASLLPPPRRARLRRVWGELEAAVGAEVQSEIGRSFIALLALGAAFRAMGLDYWALSATAAAFLRLVPLLGVLLATATVWMVTAAQGGVLGAGAGLTTLLVLGLIEDVFHTQLFAPRRASSVLFVLTAIVLMDALGLVGALLAVPIAAVLQVGLETLVGERRGPHDEALAHLADRVESLRRALDPTRAQPASEVVALADRLERLVERACGLQSGAADEPPSTATP